MTVKSYLKLAHRIGKYKPSKGDRVQNGEISEESEAYEDDVDTTDDAKHIPISEEESIEETAEHDLDAKKKKKHKKKKHHRKQKEKDRVWLRFLQRAFIGTLNEDDIKSFDDEILVHIQKPLIPIPDEEEELHGLEL
ncbi:hypothetical protein DID88_003402 [Monilinia fructigena]|uniref:Uncharacterized protein n=1 Tax=Monilinia fructigena TaxID=38457 RepID=A0A395IUQ5_9HELO|nr:hypothetical protein DID88_003402 [Monilinia fructigena]